MAVATARVQRGLGNVSSSDLDFFLPSFPICTPLFTLLHTDGRWNVRWGGRERSVTENAGPCSQGGRSCFQIWFCLSAGGPSQGTDLRWASVTL